MVNRGWIPRNDRTSYKMEKITDSMEIVGIIRKTENRPPFVPANTPMKGVWHYRYKDCTIDYLIYMCVKIIMKKFLVILGKKYFFLVTHKH